ncbi:protein toll-like [Drosophila obscura]|uniref:protein toll-like n=1 Tax=Drosophila obscura TaxID=7282 RepID=UPI001BB229D6|nr:protein toll-like [Drosophila obscura]
MCFKSNNRIETNHFQLDLQAGHLRIKWKESRGSAVSNVTAITDERATKLESLTVTGIPSSEDVRFRPGIDYIRDLGVATVLKYEIYSKDLIVLETESSLMEGPSDLTLIYTLSSGNSIDSHAANTYIRGTMNNLKTIQICHGQESQTPEFWMEDGIFRGKAQLRLLAFQGFKMENLTAHTLEDLKGLKILNFINTTVEDQSFLSSETLRRNLEIFIMNTEQVKVELRYFENYSMLKFVNVVNYEPHENLTAFVCDSETWKYDCKFSRGPDGRRCPGKCQCYYEQRSSEFKIDCRNRNLTEIPPLPTAMEGKPVLLFSNNNLRALPSNGMEIPGYNQLQTLDVAANKITSLGVHQLPQRLQHLSLSYNNITALDKKVVEYLAKHIAVRHFGNSWFSDCEDKVLQEYSYLIGNFRGKKDAEILHFLQSRAERNRFSENPWSCFWEIRFLISFLGKREGMKYIAPLDYTDFRGPCPEACSCLLTSYPTEFIVDCSGEGLSAIPPLPTPKDRPTTLLFQNNKLRALPNDTWPGYGNVGRLFLANNRLTALHHLPHNLTYLDIRNNRISAIRRKTLEFLARRKESSDLRLFLSGNPWACTCEEKDFLGFVKGGGSRIGDATNITCGDTPGNLLIDTEESDICPSGLVHYVTLTVSFMLMVLTINLIIYFKQPLLIWCYEHDVCLSLAARRELDERKKFDAFLSFTHKDEELIGEFVERLENGGQKFRLCFYLRDWLVGESIPECISQSVKDSRRIIILMTNNFLKSTWGRLEFRLALHATSQDRCKRLIVVLYPEVENFDDLDSELRAYMVLSTYLKRDDPNFWSKLIYSMPHTRQGEP